MGRIVHTHKDLSVVIAIIHQHGIFPFEAERQPPIAADIHRPVVLQIAAQGMQPPAGRVHVLRGFGIVQRGQLQFQLVRMMGLDFRFRSRFEEPLDTLVPEAFDHCV
jgi:hypothetical protein